MDSTSPSGSIDSVDHYKALRTGLISVVAVFLTAGIQAVSTAIQGGNIHLGSLSLFATAIVGVLSYVLDLVRRYFTNYTA